MSLITNPAFEESMQPTSANAETVATTVQPPTCNVPTIRNDTIVATAVVLVLGAGLIFSCIMAWRTRPKSE